MQKPDKSTFPAIGVVLTVVTMLLAGCADTGGVKPQTKMLEPGVAGLTQGSATPAIRDSWWEVFNDPQLDALVSKALADHPSLQAAQARLQRAQAAVNGAHSNQLPQVNASFDATSQRFSDNGLIPPPYAGTNQTTSTLQLNATWEVDFFGRNRAALQSALGNERAAEAEKQAARTLLASNVARAYFQLARLQAQREVAESTLAQRTSMLQLIRQRFQAGLDTKVELRQGEGSLPDVRLQIEVIDEQMALTRHTLAELTVQPPNALDDLKPRLHNMQPVPFPVSVPADLLGRRPDVEAARERAEAAVQDLKVARTQFYPNVNLTAFAGYSSVGMGNLLDSGSRQYGIGPAINLPIFDAGRIRANYKVKASDVDTAISTYNATVLSAVHEVADQISTLQSIERQEREQQEAQDSADHAYELATQRYQAGLSSYLTVLSAESMVLMQHRSTTDLKARALDTQVVLMRALGGGYAAPATQTNEPH